MLTLRFNPMIMLVRHLKYSQTGWSCFFGTHITAPERHRPRHHCPRAKTSLPRCSSMTHFSVCYYTATYFIHMYLWLKLEQLTLPLIKSTLVSSTLSLVSACLVPRSAIEWFIQVESLFTVLNRNRRLPGFP